MITLDGVMQAPGGPEEDTSGGLEYGGWTAPYGDEIGNTVLQKEMQTTDYLLGRKTFDIWASYWPKHADIWPGKLFDNEAIPAAFKVIESTITSTGVILAKYKRAGKVETGNVGE